MRVWFSHRFEAVGVVKELEFYFGVVITGYSRKSKAFSGEKLLLLSRGNLWAFRSDWSY